MGHTPGPWIIAGRDGIAIAPAALPDERLAVAMAMNCELTEDVMYGEDVPLASQVANARLMAAAPELLEALRIAADAIDMAQAQVDSENDRYNLCKKLVSVKRVIAKAEGRE